MCECNHKLLTLKQAAFELGLPYFKVQRAARVGLFPTYKLFNSRSLVRLADIEAALRASTSPAHFDNRPVNSTSAQSKPLIGE